MDDDIPPLPKQQPKSGPSSEGLSARVLNWVKTEGLPTEYKTAHLFRKSGFRVFQGWYVEGQDDGKPREVDVLAELTLPYRNEKFLRANHIVECKWSGERPWVVFTSPSRMSPTACIAQTYSDLLGESLLWAASDYPSLHSMRLFQTPAEAGFNGRQAFAGGQDYFYKSIQGVTGNAISDLERYNRASSSTTFPKHGVMSFPMIVIDGQLFKAFFNDQTMEMEVEEVNDIRCHWRGSTKWRLNSTVDLVTLKSLKQFVEVRAKESLKLMQILRPIAEQIEECWDAGSLTPLGLRAKTNLPALLGLISQNES